MSLFHRVWVAGGKRDHFFHRDCWRVLHSILADMKHAIREPMSPAFSVTTTVYPALVIDYAKCEGALGT